MRIRPLLLLLACVAAGGATAADGFKSGVFDPPRQAPEFSLQGTDGQTLNLNRYHGKVVLLAFGYSSCTAVCPVTLHTFAVAVRKLGPAAAGVQVVYVTVDPERDTPARLRQFLANFDPALTGATVPRSSWSRCARTMESTRRSSHTKRPTFMTIHRSPTCWIARDGYGR